MRALVYGSPTVLMAEDVHMHLKFLDESENTYFEDIALWAF
jgi:hypothetical protein